MKINIKGAIDIEFELGKISSSTKFAKQFGLSTGYVSKDVTIQVKDLKITEKQRSLLSFLGVEYVVGSSGMEYNDYIFVTNRGTYTTHDFDYGSKAYHEVSM